MLQNIFDYFTKNSSTEFRKYVYTWYLPGLLRRFCNENYFYGNFLPSQIFYFFRFNHRNGVNLGFPNGL